MNPIYTQFIQTLVTNGYIQAVVIMLVVFVFLKPTLFALKKIVLSFTSKTTTELDDAFVNAAYTPTAWTFILIGLRISIEQLPISEQVQQLIHNSINSINVIILAYVAYKFVDIILAHIVKTRVSDNAMRKSLASVVLSFLNVILFALAILYIMTIWGVDIKPLLAGLGLAGLAVALALQPALANIFNGISLILDKSIKVDDIVYLDATTKGRVDQIGVRSTKLVTFDNEYIIVPNSKLADSVIQNIALPNPQARCVIPFSVAYGSDVTQVKKIVLDVLPGITGFISEPQPQVRFIEMGASALNFKAYFFVESYTQRFDAIDQANTRIYTTLASQGIKIPYPTMEVLVTPVKGATAQTGVGGKPTKRFISSQVTENEFLTE
jgi:MscS family membrane protein